MDNITKILIIDDHVMFREGLISLFNQQPDFEVVGDGGKVREAIRLAKELRPDMILMDFHLPDGTGIEASRIILAKNPKINIVFLSINDEDEIVYSAMRAGAKGFLLKNLPIANLLNSLRRVIEGEAAISRRMTRLLIEKIASSNNIPQKNMPTSTYNELTTREMEILRVLASDASNKEIAIQLGISVHTVKNHVSNVLGKLALKNRREAATYARQHELD